MRSTPALEGRPRIFVSRDVLIIAVALSAILLAPTDGAAQHRWKSPGRPSTRQEAIRPPTSGVRAAIGGGSNGVYCPDMSEGAVGVHDLGWIPKGLKVEVTVESSTEGAFDPVAAVLAPAMGQTAGNAVKVTTFYDNDTGGEKDPKVSFVAPQAGTYLLTVADNLGTNFGCYRYQVLIFP